MVSDRVNQRTSASRGPRSSRRTRRHRLDRALRPSTATSTTPSTRASVDLSAAPSDPGPVRVVRLRHPSRWVATVVIARAAGDVRQRSRDEPAVGLADLLRVLHRPVDPEGAADHLVADAVGHGARLRTRHRARRDAVVEEPAAAVGELDLHLAVPVDPADRQPAVLVQPRLPLPDAVDRDPVRAELLVGTRRSTCSAR